MRQALATTDPGQLELEDAGWATPFERPGLARRIWAFGAVALLAEASLALSPGPVSTVDTVISIVLLAVTVGLVVLPWQRMPAWATVVVPFTYVGSVMMLILAAGGATSGVGVIILIPLVWTALYHRRWESVIITAAIVGVELVISLDPKVASAAVIARRVGFWAALGLVVSFGIQSLRDQLREVFGERERLHTAQTEHLRRTEALELAAEELTAYLDPLEVISAASRLAALLVCPPGSDLRRGQYIRAADGIGHLAAEYDESGIEIPGTFSLADHPALQRVFDTGEPWHGPPDLEAVGSGIKARMDTLRLIHSVYVPIKLGGDVDGVLAVSMREGELPEELFDQCKAIGHLTELALGNAMAHRGLRELATTDSLTGLANRRAFEQLMEQRPGRSSFAVLVIDLDGLKEVNDSRGHLAGDTLLVEVAATLSRVMRRGDVLARVGGDEFAVLAFEADLEAGQEIARRMLDALKTVEFVGASASASIGVAVGSPTDGAIETFHAADSAMYKAKREGGDRFALAAPTGR
ncbi:MAG: GGDEF domain-containing protein [Acidimicrobiales bacterium]